jgi:hypothetical protein
VALSDELTAWLTDVEQDNAGCAVTDGYLLGVEQTLERCLGQVKALERDLTSEQNVANNLRDQLRRRMERLRELEGALTVALGTGHDVLVGNLTKQVEALSVKLQKLDQQRVPDETPNGGCFTAVERDDLCSVEVWYPRVREQRTGKIPTVYVGLMDVRASDGIFIRYDFERDGWVIMQEPGKEGDDCVEDTGPPQEVAFARSWALVEDTEEVTST